MQTCIKKTAKKLLLVTIVATMLGTMAVSVYANAIFLLNEDKDSGTTVWLSCGSSAGNYTYTCTGGICTSMYDDPWGANQAGADEECRNRGYSN